MKEDNLNGGQNYLYEEIMTGIKEYINENQLQPGDRIPTEKELGKLFKASRISIRRAIKELVDEGVLKIIHGRGTFVNKKRKEIHLLHLQGFSEGLTSDNDKISKEIVSMKKISNNKKVNSIFENKYTEFIELIRKVYRNDQILSMDYAYLPTAIYPNIEDKIKKESSTFKIIHDDYRIAFKTVKKELEIVPATEELQKHLNISRLTPLILVEKIIYNEHHQPVHYSEYYLISDAVKLRIENNLP
ncbi:GntR family transcriptional regulator [Oceanobacillus sp. FSL W8-0428]|uniref:GntR family transcriptional regulator n=1 Tax=Oceanobacillus sojae TaxID=582851 RepID=A0A511ZEC8_9BACI|nr:GntR family transcriptional regulator [Oceanobacillus sojae]GEN85803.1 GntR family transcriptional regulator [Oceanobacillus sojae]